MKSFIRMVPGIVGGLILLFAAVAVIETLADLPWCLHHTRIALPLGLGFAIVLLFLLLTPRFVMVYIVGHELTHWCAAKFFQRRTGRFRIGRQCGSVDVERPNIWITLAPYFTPLYALFVLGLYGVMLFLWPAPPLLLTQSMMAAIGGAYAFHVRLTIYALRREQADLRAYGRFFSLCLILFCNSLLLLMVAAAVSGQWGNACRLLGSHCRRNIDSCLASAQWLQHAQWWKQP